MSDREPVTQPERRPDRAALSVAGLLLIVAAVVVWDALRLPPPGRYDPLGPSGFPYLVAGGLAILGGLNVYAAYRGRILEREPQNFVPVIVIITGLLIQMALLRPLGFTVATGILFATAAYGFGERRLYITVPFGLVLAGVVWFVFARLLKLTLPEGPPEHRLIRTIATLPLPWIG